MKKVTKEAKFLKKTKIVIQINNQGRDPEEEDPQERDSIQVIHTVETQNHIVEIRSLILVDHLIEEVERDIETEVDEEVDHMELAAEIQIMMSQDTRETTHRFT